MTTKRPFTGNRQNDKNAKKQRLSAGESTSASQENQFLVLFEPDMRKTALKIINKLDPKSFSNLACTCKTVRSACLNGKSVLIRVEDSAYVDRSLAGKCFFEYQSDWICRLNGRFGPKLSFNIKIELLTLTGTVDSSTLEYARKNFDKIPVTRVQSLVLDGSSNWPEIIHFIKEFGVRCLIVNHSLPKPQMTTILGMKLTSFTHAKPLPFDVILSSPIPHLNLFDVDVSMENLELIIEKWMYEDHGLISWSFHSKLNHKTALHHFRMYDVREFDCRDALSGEKPLAFRKKRTFRHDNEEFTYFLPCDDGRVLRVVKTDHWHGDKLKISFCPLKAAPPALRFNDV